ncbi:SelB C-terminal domain-containing protein [Nocardioides panacisoli]|uniref:Selenocysteine-specific translation elongation factor n=1 Tax=Nocardioides panacisoli TaxID=627624 RepID=A0ABP7HU56_9ACTN
MHVVATAGHVDHGKSTLVAALTGMEPDRLAEERRRGLSIELGYVWTELAGAGQVAFVDVPGHERFVSTMLAGIGPVPAALLVVAADDPWMPQAAEHLAALDALGVRHGVVAVTRSDLADPAPAAARAAAEIARTTLAGSPVVAVSGRTGAGLDELRAALVTMVGGLPAADPAGDVRLWVDRTFTVRGAGTVVTGTLPAGTVRRGDLLGVLSERGAGTVRVRGVQALGAERDAVSGVARVALNLVGDGVPLLERGAALVTEHAWHATAVADVRVAGGVDALPERPLLHVGAVAVAVHARPLGLEAARLTLPHALPLRVGDRALLRDPGSRRVWGLRVLDPAPPPLRRRGASARRAERLSGLPAEPDPAEEVRRRGLVQADLLRRIGVPVDDVPAGAIESDGWLMSAAQCARLADEITSALAEHVRAQPLDPGIPLPALAARLGIPSPGLVAAAVRPPLRVRAGRVEAPGSQALPAGVEAAVAAVENDLADAPFAAPTADRLGELRLDDRGAAAAARAGRLLRVAPGVVLLPGADVLAARWLAELPQPFTTSAARQRLGTSRRVVLPLLAHLDRAGLTSRLPDDRREVRPAR